MEPAGTDPAGALEHIRRTQADARVALSPDPRLLCLVWGSAWSAVTVLLGGVDTLGWPVVLTGTGLAFALAGVTSGVHTARRTGLAVEGPSMRRAARLGRACGAAFGVGTLLAVVLALRGVPIPDAARLGLGVAASAIGGAALATAVLPGRVRHAVAGAAFATGLVWVALPDPAPSAGLLAAALVVAGLVVGRPR